MINGKDLVKYFSDVEGDYLTSEERAFCEGYYYAQKESSDLQRTMKGIMTNIKSIPRKLKRDKKYRDALKQMEATNQQFLGPVQYDPKTGRAFQEVSEEASKYYTPETKERNEALYRVAKLRKSNPPLLAGSYKFTNL